MHRQAATCMPCFGLADPRHPTNTCRLTLRTQLKRCSPCWAAAAMAQTAAAAGGWRLSGSHTVGCCRLVSVLYAAAALLLRRQSRPTALCSPASGPLLAAVFPFAGMRARAVAAKAALRMCPRRSQPSAREWRAW